MDIGELVALARFLKTEVDEDERTVRLVEDGPGVGVDLYEGGDAAQRAMRAFLDRFDEERVLREVAAKRKLINEVWDGEEGFPTEHTAGRSAEAVLRLIAIPYADRPGFKESWRS